MRASAILQPLLVAMLAAEGAQSAFIVNLVRGLGVGLNAAVRGAVMGAVRNQGIIRHVGNLRSGPGNIMRNAANSVRTRFQSLSPETQKFLKYNVITTAMSGGLSGTISGSISGNAAAQVAANNDNAKTRRAHTDRAMMLNRAVMGDEGNEEPSEPGLAPENIDQDVWELCFWDIVWDIDAEIVGEDDWIELRGLSPACAHIETKLAEVTGDGGGINCGEGCLRYEGLTDEEMKVLGEYLDALMV